MCFSAAPRHRPHLVVHGAPPISSSARVSLLRLAAAAIGCLELLSVGHHQQQQQQQQEDAEAPAPDPKGRHNHPLPHRLTTPQQPPVVAAGDNPADAGGGTTSFSWLTVLGFVLLTFNSIMAILRSNGERATVVFVGFSYADLVVLFWCLRRYEDSEPGSVARARLKAAVWALTTALTLLFSTKVAAVMPPPVALVVWLMAFVTIAGGFIAFFCHTADGEKPRNLKLYLLDH